MPRASRICRLCLAQEPSLDIFSDYSIRDKIIEYCGVDIEEKDGLPPKICNACYENINGFANFKFKCQENDSFLRRKLDQSRFHYIDEIEKIQFRTEDCMGFFKKLPDKFMNSLDFEQSESNDESDNFLLDQNFGTAKIQSNIDSGSIDPCQKKISEEIKKKMKTFKYLRKKRKMVDRAPKLCPICGVIFGYQGFDRHFQTHFKNPETYICDICKKVFITRNKLIQHLQIHGEKNEPCEYCGKLFVHRINVNKHIHQFHLKDHHVKCETCGKMFSKGALKIHKLIHLGVKPFQCEVCNNLFSSKTALQGHIRIHTGERPYRCKFCDSHFRTLADIKAHERLHTGETPYECSVCSRGYAQLCNLKSHFKNNHKGINFSYVKKKSVG